MPSLELVLARYREDVSWADGLGYPYIVIDKSGEPGPYALPNLGRETQSYLWYICRRYPDFADYTVFLQADPFKHLSEGSGPRDLRLAIERNLRLDVQFTGFAWYKLKCDGLGRPHDMRKPESEGRWAGFGRDIPLAEIYAQLFAGEVPNEFLVSAPAGLLFVARPRILARPQQFYRRALAIVEADPQDERNTGHAFERLWPCIFNGKSELNKPSYDE